MKTYTKVYLRFFDFTIADFIPCEVCGEKTVDIHHIEARSIAKELLNLIANLMALCRKHHTQYGDKKQHKEALVQIHDEYMNTKTINLNNQLNQKQDENLHEQGIKN